MAHLLSLGLSSCVEMSIGLFSLYGGEEDVVYYCTTTYMHVMHGPLGIHWLYYLSLGGVVLIRCLCMNTLLRCIVWNVLLLIKVSFPFLPNLIILVSLV